nr:immunoglobulin heavy chain junction region [Macaca mulatta]MOW23214.1 immunoglobulin heavy chain junction region [Macaca mulatta]MOW24348.1 immunoglobulin heavy chain junction region [Macaca mulatta]MOW24546.1 immunoglobulin heavy chain junction region [Macaca mulatta]MOW25282.1 immunoglobulin heavy chain junction region [Macaca mulatta]
CARGHNHRSTSDYYVPFHYW